MSTIKTFEELTIWQDARKITNEIYFLTKKFPKEELFGLTSQIRRASISIMSNIAEGFNRRSKKEFISFLIFSRASTFEVQNDLYIALDLEYINKDEFEKYYKFTEKIAMSINKLIKYLRSQIKISCSKNDLMKYN